MNLIKNAADGMERFVLSYIAIFIVTIYNLALLAMLVTDRMTVESYMSVMTPSVALVTTFWFKRRAARRKTPPACQVPEGPK